MPNYTFQKLPNGKIEVMENGKSISNGTGFTASYAQSLGYNPAQGDTQLPSMESTSNAGLPGKPSNPLLSFADTMDKAVQLAKQSRNASSLSMMTPFQGTVAASDFSSILGNLNNASDTFSQDVLKRATEANKTTYDTLTDATGAVYQVQKDANGQIIGKPVKLFGGKAPAGDGGDALLSVSEAQALGVPYGTRRSEAYGQTPTKPLTEAQAKDVTYGTRADQANAIIVSNESALSSFNPVFFASERAVEPNTIGNTFVSDTTRQTAQAERNFLTAILRRESGATIQPSEFATAEKQYFPRPGDDPKTLQQKAQNRATAIASFQASTGQRTTSGSAFSGTTSSGLKYTVSP